MAAAASSSANANRDVMSELFKVIRTRSLSDQEVIQRIQALIERGADINGFSADMNQSYTLIQYAFIEGSPSRNYLRDTILFLIHHPLTDLTRTNKNGVTALQWIIYLLPTLPHGFQFIDEILQRNTDVINMQDHIGYTPLISMVEYFTDEDAEVDERDRDDYVAAIIHMIQLGGDVTIENNDGNSVMSLLDEPFMSMMYPHEHQQILDAIEAQQAATAAASSAVSTAAQQGGRKRMQRRSHRKRMHKRSSHRKQKQKQTFKTNTKGKR